MITYDLRGGLDIDKEILGAQNSVTHLHIPGADFEPLNPEAPEVAAAEIARKHPHFQEIGGRTLVVMGMNEDAKDSTIFGMSWGANFEHPIGEEMVACVASLLPDEAILSWNGFGRGEANKSSRIGPKAIKHARKTGSFDLVGREYAERLAPLLDGKEDITLLGVSEGARIIVSAAAHLGRSVKNVVILDGPGTLGMGFARYVHRFMAENKHSKQYIDATMDPKIKGFVEEHHDPSLRGQVILRDIRSGILGDHYISSPKAMAKQGLRQDLMTAAPHITGKLAYILPQYTNLNDPLRIRSDMQAIAVANPDLQTELWSFPGSHAVINAGLMVEATLLAYALKH